MPPGLLAYNFCRRLILDAFVGDISRRRLRGALDNDTLDALVDGASRLLLVRFLALPASLALAVSALTAAAEPPFSDIALARAASASAIRLSIVTFALAAASAVACLWMASCSSCNSATRVLMCFSRAKAAALCRLALYPASTYTALADMPRASA